MLKKSLFWNAVVLMAAVLFIFTACEGPQGPQGTDGQVGPSEIGDISVGIEIKEPEVILPNGFTYPDGAQVVSGNATAIATAFNGGIFVADTSDATGATVSGTDYVYSQDGVDQVVWAGPGNSTGNLGSISVPPGKTLFIGAPLILASPGSGINTYFSGISVSDQGALPQASIQYANVPGKGGAKIDATNKGTVVILAGAEITNAGINPEVFTIGGNLEIHQGGSVAFTGAYAPEIKTTAGSSTTVFGVLSGVNADISGTLAIEGRGSVETTGTARFDDTVTINGLGSLSDGPGGAYFYGTVSVGPSAGVTLGGGILIANEFALDGTLYAGANSVVLAANSTSHLKVGATGRISASAWNQFILDGALPVPSVDTHLLAALDETSPSAKNNHITIAAVKETPIYLDVGEVEASSYANFALLLKSETLHLEDVLYPNSLPAPTTAELATPLEIAKDNYGIFEARTTSPFITALGDITVQKGGALLIGGATPTTNVITSAGDITVIGNGRGEVVPTWASVDAFTVSTVSFGTRLNSLTIGDTEGTETVVELPAAATLASVSNPNTVITVNKNASLVLDPDTVVNPPNKIELVKGDAGKGNGGKLLFINSAAAPAATFAALNELIIGEEALFSGYEDSYLETATPTSINTITFANLTILTVSGTLDVPSTAATLFAKLQVHVSDVTSDVGGSGKAVLTGWAIDGETNGHAFDQILGIKDVTVASITNVPNTSGLDAGKTPDRGTTTGDGYKLTVRGAITVLNTNKLTIDRNLNLGLVTSSIAFGAGGGSIVINNGSKVLSLDGDVLEGTTVTRLISAGAATLTATNGKGTLITGTAAITLDPAVATSTNANVLNIPGTLESGSGGNIIAGQSNSPPTLYGTVTLAASSIKNGSITSKPVNVDDVSAGIVSIKGTGIMTIGGASTVYGYYTDDTHNAQSAVELAKGGSIVTDGGTLTFSGTGGPNIADNSTITADADSTSIAAVTVNNIEIKGALSVTAGSLVAPATKAVLVTGKVTALTNGSAYDYAALEKATLTQGTVNGGTGTILVTNTLVGDTGSILVTRGKGNLAVGTLATLQSAPQSSGTLPTQSLAGVTLSGGSGLTKGGLALTSGSLLSVEASGFNVGLTGTGNEAALSVDTTSTVAIKGGATIIVYKDDTLGSGGKGSFSFGSVIIRGNTGTGADTFASGITGGTNSATAVTDINNLITATGGVSTGTTPASSTLGQVSYTGGTYTITAPSSSVYHNISSSSALYLGL